MTKKTDTKPEKKAPATNKKSDQPERKLISENTTFTLTLSAADVAAQTQKTLQRVQRTFKLAGFREGKVPLKLVEQNIDRSRFLSLVVEDLLPVAYEKHIVENKLAPLTDPEVIPESLEEGKDWVFKVSIAVRPEIKLGDYKTIVQKLKKSSDLWKKDETDEKEAAAQRQERLNAILPALLEKVEIQVPELLLRRETEQQLRQFAKQLEQLNIPLPQYLTSIGRSEEEFQQDQAARALGNLQVELLLSEVIRDLKLEATDEEVEKLFHPDGHNHGHDHQHSAQEVSYGRAVLLKQKAFDSLLSL